VERIKAAYVFGMRGFSLALFLWQFSCGSFSLAGFLGQFFVDGFL